MIEYMKTINDKQFIKNLCDDIAIVLKTIGTKYGEMLTYSRQHSQGEGRAHQVTNISEIEDNIQRSGARRNQRSFQRGASRVSYDSDSDDELVVRAACPSASSAYESDSDDEPVQRAACPSSTQYCSQTAYAASDINISPVDDIIDNYDISDNLDTTCSQTKLFVIRSISGN
jgi:hypothetical protein